MPNTRGEEMPNTRGEEAVAVRGMLPYVIDDVTVGFRCERGGLDSFYREYARAQRGELWRRDADLGRLTAEVAVASARWRAYYTMRFN